MLEVSTFGVNAAEWVVCDVRVPVKCLRIPDVRSGNSGRVGRRPAAENLVLAELRVVEIRGGVLDVPGEGGGLRRKEGH